jgi:hypothetical protein
MRVLEGNEAAFLLLPILVMHHFLFASFGYFESINLCVAQHVDVGCKKLKRNFGKGPIRTINESVVNRYENQP